MPHFQVHGLSPTSNTNIRFVIPAESALHARTIAETELHLHVIDLTEETPQTDPQVAHPSDPIVMQTTPTTSPIPVLPYSSLRSSPSFQYLTFLIWPMALISTLFFVSRIGSRNVLDIFFFTFLGLSAATILHTLRQIARLLTDNSTSLSTKPPFPFLLVQSLANALYSGIYYFFYRKRPRRP